MSKYNLQGAPANAGRVLAEGETAIASSSQSDCDPSRSRINRWAAVPIIYTNWRGETAVRKIVPWPGTRVSPLWFGQTEWHPEPQWLLTARDAEKDGVERDFALSGIRAWGAEAVAAAQAIEDKSAVDEVDVPVKNPPSSPRPDTGEVEGLVDALIEAAVRDGRLQAGGAFYTGNSAADLSSARTALLSRIRSTPPAGLEDLERLSREATQGEWLPDVQVYYDEDDGSPEDHTEGVMVLGYDEEPDSIIQCSKGDAEFIIALVNAYRSGHLVARAALAESERKRVEAEKQEHSARKKLEWLKAAYKQSSRAADTAEREIARLSALLAREEAHGL